MTILLYILSDTPATGPVLDGNAKFTSCYVIKHWLGIINVETTAADVKPSRAQSQDFDANCRTGVGLGDVVLSIEGGGRDKLICCTHV